jgi:hypothetical protein
VALSRWLHLVQKVGALHADHKVSHVQQVHDRLLSTLHHNPVGYVPSPASCRSTQNIWSVAQGQHKQIDGSAQHSLNHMTTLRGQVANKEGMQPAAPHKAGAVAAAPTRCTHSQQQWSEHIHRVRGDVSPPPYY